MRIVHESPDLLVVAEPAVGMRTVGGVLAAIGAVLFALGLSPENATAKLPGAVILAVGAMFVALPAIKTFYFNRGEKRLVVARRRLWNPPRTGRYDEYPLSDVVAAQVDQSSSSDGGATYRVIVRLADGRAIPFTPFYTSGFRSKSEMANRISRFLGVAQGTQSVGGALSPHTIAPTNRKNVMGVALVFMGFGLVFGSIGGVALAREYRRLAEWRPVQATVVGTRVDTHYDSDGNTHSVDDRAHTSSRTLPMNESRSGRWADRVIARFRVGGQYTAWYDPTSPSDAFIVRSHSIVAPIFTLLGALALIGGCAGAMSARRVN